MSDLIELCCTHHPDRPATGQCEMCGDLLCDECRAIIGGKDYCLECARLRLRAVRIPPGETAYLSVSCGFAVLGWVAMGFIDAETALGFAPAALAWGLFGLVWGVTRGPALAAAVGASMLIMVAGLTSAVVYYGWGPPEAQGPFAAVLGGYTLLILVATVARVSSAPPSDRQRTGP